MNAFELAVKERLEQLPEDLSDLDQAGPIENVGCTKIGKRFRGSEVFVCDVDHAREIGSVWCAARVGNAIVTHVEAEDLPCLTHSRPRTGG